MKNNLSFKIIKVCSLRNASVMNWCSLILLFYFFSPSLVQGQDRKLILKINDPAPVCYPAWVDLTVASITAGSTEGLHFSYYSDQAMSVPVKDPSRVGEGIYYVKGVLGGVNPSYVAAAIHVTIKSSPKLMVVNEVKSTNNGCYDITSTNITLGSDAHLTYSYWQNKELTVPVKTPDAVTKGVYYIKGVSINGCFDSQPIRVE